MSTRPPLTLEQHAKLGAELMDLYARLQAIEQRLSAAYGPHSRPWQKTRYVVNALGRLRSELRTQLFAEAGVTGPNPRLAKVYWPPLRQAGAPAGSGGVQG